MFDDIEPGWIWAIGGVVVLMAEIVAPGFFLLFVGAAAIATGIFTLMFDLGPAPQLALFAIYTGLAVMLGKRFYAQPDTPDQQVGLNDPGKRLVGKSVVVVDPIDEHGGRVRVGDGEWTARGGPAAVGERVTIIGVDGNCLKVEPTSLRPSLPGTSQ